MSSHPKKRRRRITKFDLNETSLVDHPAHEPARIVLMKRKGDTPDVEPIEKRMALTTLTAGHAHSIIMVQAGSESLAELRAGQTSWSSDHVHDWIMDDAGNIIIADVEGHSHGIAALVTKSDDSVDTDKLAESMLATLAPDNETASVTKAAESGAETNIMTPEEKAAFEKAAEDQLNIEKTRGDRAEQIVKLSPEQRQYFDALAEGQDEFLSAENKDEIVKNACDADPVVHTDLDGNEIRKSEGATVLRLSKSNDELRKNAAKNEAIAKRAEFVKRAGEELQHLTGETDVKANLLKAVATLTTEEQAPVLAILKSKDAGMAKAFETLGTSDDGNGEGANAEMKMNELAKRTHEAQPNLTPEQAYVAALDTPEGRELHAQLSA